LFVAAIFGVGNLRAVPASEDTWTSCRGFGKITGYTLVHDTLGRFDAGIPYDFEGNPVREMMVVPRLGTAALTIKGHPIPPSLFQRWSELDGGVRRCGGLVLD